MAVPIIVTSAITTARSGVTDPDLTMPSGVVSGNLLVLLIHADVATSSGSFFVTPTGWTQFQYTRPTGSFTEAAGYYRISNGTEGASVAFDASGQPMNAYVANIMRVTGHDALAPINVAGAVSSAGGGTTATMVSATTTVNDCLLIGMAGNNYGTLSALVVTGTGWTLREEGSPGTGSTSIRVAFTVNQQLTAGATPEGTVIFPNSDYWEAFQFAIAPAEVLDINNAIMFGMCF